MPYVLRLESQGALLHPAARIIAVCRVSCAVMLVARLRSAQRLAVWPRGFQCCALGASASAQ
eukprot:8435890-Alexandrium_andersonii.AAC.1